MEFIEKFLPYLISTLVFLIAQIIIYNKLKWDVEVLKQSVNGIGKKVNDIKEQVGENLVEEIQRYSDLKERIGKITGMLDVILNPKRPNGHA